MFLSLYGGPSLMVKLNILKTSHGFVGVSDVNIFRGCTLLGSSRTHVGAKQFFVIPVI